MNHHTNPNDASVLTWAPLDDEWEITAPAVIDLAFSLEGGRPLFARLNYDEAIAVGALIGAFLPTQAQIEQLREVGLQLTPYLGTPRAENEIEHSRKHDADVWRQLAALEWDGVRAVAGCGKHWIAGAPPDKSRLMGWDKDGAGPGKVWWQPPAVAHNRMHYDDGTTTLLVRRRRVHDTDPAPTPKEPPPVTTPRPTLRRGSHGPDVIAWQTVLNKWAAETSTALIVADGDFGPATERLSKAWQAAHGLVNDGVVGEKSWRVAGQPWDLPKSGLSRAVTSLLRDVNATFPTRKKQSDGTWGDLAHQKTKSDHNTGDAVDITHDPASGCSGARIADLAIRDPRVKYVIWNNQIFNRSLGDKAWRPYHGSNPHTHHCHVSMLQSARDNDGPWNVSP